jgi:hypothetical protein
MVAAERDSLQQQADALRRDLASAQQAAASRQEVMVPRPGARRRAAEVKPRGLQPVLSVL